MGFLDKAKQLAEQAQQKLDEAQKNFNQSESPQAQTGEGAVRYDEHGRPIQEAAPAGAAPPPAEPAAPAPPPDPASPPPPPDPASSSPPSDPVSPSDAGGTERDAAGAEADPARTEGHPAGPEPTRQPETGESGGGQANSSPDPFKPLQQ